MAGTQNAPQNAQGRLGRIARSMGGPMNVAFVGIDAGMRMSDGESAPVAVGKSLLTNAAFSLIPGGLIGVAAIGAAMAAPEINEQLRAASGRLNAKKRQFGGNFEETEAQIGLMQQGLGRMQDARMQATRRMANHARGAQQVY